MYVILAIFREKSVINSLISQILLQKNSFVRNEHRSSLEKENMQNRSSNSPRNNLNYPSITRTIVTNEGKTFEI